MLFFFFLDCIEELHFVIKKEKGTSTELASFINLTIQLPTNEFAVFHLTESKEGWETKSYTAKFVLLTCLAHKNQLISKFPGF